MVIISQLDLNVRSLEEFSRILVPEALEKEIYIKDISNESNISLEMKIDNKSQVFSYDDLGSIIDDQKLTMIKIMLLMFYGKDYSWGGLMGVRPTKILRRMLSDGCTLQECRNILRDLYKVKEDKIDLLSKVVTLELQFLDKEQMNIYIGIPYCPTKCTYCSFASYEIGGGVGRYYQDFIKTLLKEIELAGKFLRENKYRIGSIYIGGGTPSVMSYEDMHDVLENVSKYIDMSELREYTFEAGREDTLTKEKIDLMKKYDVTRMSLNPQTFNLHTLKQINRKFDKVHFDEMFYYARSLGLDINMDLIIGLPGENTDDILHTFDILNDYDVEDITIHALAFKRASDLFKQNKERIQLDKKKISDKIKEITAQKNMLPYYLYRQKNIVEWGDNVGYCKDGHASVFNIEMIEEDQNTFGIGGGAMTKFIAKDAFGRDVIHRIVNPKDPSMYINEMEMRMQDKFALFKKGDGRK